MTPLRQHVDALFFLRGMRVDRLQKAESAAILVAL